MEELFTGWGSSEREKQNRNSKSLLSVEEESLPVVQTSLETHQNIMGHRGTPDNGLRRWRRLRLALLKPLVYSHFLL